MSETPTINIDMDRKCKRCKKGGATQGGYCLSCVSKNLKEGKYNHLIKPLKDKYNKETTK